MSDYIEVPQEAVAKQLDTLIAAAQSGARIVIVKDGKARAYIRPANPDMTEDMYDAILALRGFALDRGISDEQVRAWITEDQR
ncbi:MULTISPECIES: hypothetical protein [Achromobacter]|jgi:antitoxin (DNA-binding transcriptional repressor) of toxin-antitoxin stability system|uniref:Antitoxin n=1 Tax=Achromobacter kerstersii TaxID=1353890 RepID=A0A6S7A419_9BURK|nr:hypothetical protein [Achromobacter kerstersii]CAB3711837.1 hypothetical protein LMG3441_03162 [Achromobacter kerstersii]CUI32783.1 Uncharacterised protein [Achromobacter kerstersii]